MFGVGLTIKEGMLGRLRRWRGRARVGVRPGRARRAVREAPIVESGAGHKGVKAAAEAHEGPHVGVGFKV